VGKTVGGQYFAGAGGFCGHSEIMDLLDQISKPSFWERSFQGGTYVGNALTMRAGYVAINELTRKRDELYPYIYSLGEFCMKRLNDILSENKFQGYVTGVCSMFGLHFTTEEPTNGETAERTKDLKIGQDMFQHLLNNQIAYLSPNSPHFNISGAHTQDDVEKLMSYIEAFLKSVKRK
jgi:glutamate-1-semialdehyde 2,1-aminomutase